MTESTRQNGEKEPDAEERDGQDLPDGTAQAAETAAAAEPADTGLADAVARVLDTPTFVGAVVDRVVEKVSEDVTQKVGEQLAREIIDTAGEGLSDAVADRIAEAWQRAARASNTAASNGWTLRPRQRGHTPRRGRNPKA